MPIPYPDNLTPDEPPYFIVALNETWYSIVWGVLADALGRWNWSVSDEQWVDVEQSIIKVMAMASACDPCGISIEIDVDGKLILNLSPDISVEIETPFLHSLTYNEDTRKWSWKVGDTIYSSSDVSNVYPQIDDELEPPNFDVETVDPRDHVCAGVTQTVSWLVDVWSDEAAETQLYLDGLKTAREAVTGIIEFLSGGAAELLPIDELLGFILSMGQLELDLFTQTFNSISFKEAISEALYCRILGNNNNFSENVFVDWAGDVLDIGGFPPIDWRGNLIDIIGWHRVSSHYALYSIDVENDCRFLNWCGEGWVQYWDFSEGASSDWEGFAYGSPPTTWSVYDADAWKSVYGYPAGAAPDTRARQNFLKLTTHLPLSGLLGIEITVDYAQCTNDNLGYAGNNNVYLDGPSHQPENYDWNVSETEKTFVFDLEGSGTVTYLRFSNVIGARSTPAEVVNGECRIKRIALYGTGTNPWA